jgi:hypothetical protein
MNEPLILGAIEDAVSIATRGRSSWFRGHATDCGTLTPKIFRPQYADLRNRNRWFECSLIREFKMLAITMTPNPPAMDDQLRWLFLMQHYGAPTRLLDWSENILVALYFAVEDAIDRDGELWQLDPLELNKMHKMDYIPSAEEVDETLDLFVRQPCSKLRPQDLEKIRFPYAIRPARYVPRMISQFGAFTIHPAPSQGSPANMAESFHQSESLVRYIIPRASKPRLFMDLATLGFTRRTMFGDLDALARTIVATEMHKAAELGG